MGQTNSTQDRNSKEEKYYDKLHTEEYLGESTKVGHLFKWKIGNQNINKVDLIGSFNDWENPIPMTYNKESKSFLLKLTLNGGKHLYRFIVDGKHKVDAKIKKERDENGVVNNVIQLVPGDGLSQTPSYSDSLREEAFLKKEISIESDDDDDDIQPVPELKQLPKKERKQQTHPLTSTKTTPSNTPPRTIIEEVDNTKQYREEEERLEKKKRKMKSDKEEEEKKQKKPVYVGKVLQKAPFLWDVVPMTNFGREEKQFAVTKRMPRPLPPHLRFTPLNSKPLKGTDPSIVPVPLHVTVRHLYTGNQERPFDTYGITNRYKQKYTTLVIYKPKIDPTMTPTPTTTTPTSTSS